MTPDLRISDVLGRGGVLSRRLSRFRERPQQLAMADAVGSAFAAGKHLLVEAPTGVGKSLAYLVPAILELAAKGRRVVIATHTISLQDQLLDKDLPLLAACLPVEFVAVKAMGRGNYLGLRRLGVALDESPLLVADDPEAQALLRISSWSDESRDGARQELEGRLDPGIWERVQSEGDNCFGRRCPTFEDCFYQRARRRLEHADIIVTNHALYFTDLMLRRNDMGVLPDHDALVLDEAHHVEQVAAERFGLEFSRYGVLRLLRRLAAPRGASGVLHRCEGAPRDEALGTVLTLREATLAFFDRLGRWYAEEGGGQGRIRRPGVVTDTLSEDLLRLAESLEILADQCEREELKSEVTAQAGRALSWAHSLRALLAMEDPDLVYFVEQGGDRRRIALVARPLDVAPILREELFGERRSVILTSATLATKSGAGGLAYVAGKLGAEEAEQLILDSPFDLARQVEVHVPRSIPLPDSPDFDRAAAQQVVSYVRQTRGGAFVLFTSYRALDACFELTAGPLEEEGLLLLRQGRDLDRARMLERFREDGNAVLYGAESFWEGVDVPGPALRLVIICRLPFPVPTLPLNQARAEALRRQGRSPFAHHALPEAVIRWRQGVGRLIRSEDDEGLIVCLDRRIIDKPYGARFRAALAECRWVVDEDPAEDA